jgi:AIPR protein
VFVPMKLSVVTPIVASDLIPFISRFANSQNGVRPSDFFANHAFHRRIEEVSRRILAPAVAGSQVQTHWYLRARARPAPERPGRAHHGEAQPIPTPKSPAGGDHEDRPCEGRMLLQP